MAKVPRPDTSLFFLSPLGLQCLGHSLVSLQRVTVFVPVGGFLLAWTPSLPRCMVESSEQALGRVCLDAAMSRSGLWATYLTPVSLRFLVYKWAKKDGHAGL